MPNPICNNIDRRLLHMQVSTHRQDQNSQDHGGGRSDKAFLCCHNLEQIKNLDPNCKAHSYPALAQQARACLACLHDPRPITRTSRPCTKPLSFRSATQMSDPTTIHIRRLCAQLRHNDPTCTSVSLHSGEINDDVVTALVANTVVSSLEIPYIATYS
jgi:hypothetical protein